FLFLLLRRRPSSTLFPYTTLFRSIRAARERYLSALPVPADLNGTLLRLLAAPNIASKRIVYRRYDSTVQTNTVQGPGDDALARKDRKSTRLNSSHVAISYAVFCLK